MAAEGFRHAEALGRRERVGETAAVAKGTHPRGLGRETHEFFAIRHQHGVILFRAIPFQHDEFAGVANARFAIAKDAGEVEDPALAPGEQFLQREFRRRMEIERGLSFIERDRIYCEGVEMGLVARRNLQRCRFEMAAQRRLDGVARQQAGAPVPVAGRQPPGVRHRAGIRVFGPWRALRSGYLQGDK